MTRADWKQIDALLLSKHGDYAGQILASIKSRDRRERLIELLAGNEELINYAKDHITDKHIGDRVRNRNKKRTRAEDESERDDDDDVEEVVEEPVAKRARRGHHKERIEDALARFQIELDRRVMISTFVAGTVSTEVSNSKERTIHQASNASAPMSFFVQIFENTPALVETVRDEINSFARIGDDTVMGAALTGILCTSSTVWNGALAWLEKDDIQPETRRTKLGFVTAIIKIVSDKLAGHRDRSHEVIGKIIERISIERDRLGGEARRLGKRIDRSSDKGRVKSLAGANISIYDFLDEFDAWIAQLALEIKSMAERYPDPAVRFAVITPDFLNRLAVTIAYSNISVRPSGWIAAKVDDARRALSHNNKIISFCKHKTSGTHGDQNIVLSNGSVRLMELYLDIVRPALPKGDGNLFVKRCGSQLQTIDVQAAFRAIKAITVPAVQRAWDGWSPHFTPTALRKLTVDVDMSVQERALFASSQCHSAKVQMDFYAKKQAEKAKEDAALRANQIYLQRRKDHGGVSGDKDHGGVSGDKDHESVISATGVIPPRCVPPTVADAVPHKQRHRFDWEAVQRALVKDGESILAFLEGIQGTPKQKLEPLREQLTASGLRDLAAEITTRSIHDKIKNERKKQK
jgi:hypothetical protein